ncbi:universal stress protein [Acrocarpospora sp. B8E8]|uniref:universal stress protein n=1 Tax=Acrocarpospora sp. B8E8 TaxID=3153572 RepID=UPI00325D01C5
MSYVIAVGADGSTAADAALRWAADDAERRGALRRVVHALDCWPHDIPKYTAGEWDDTLIRTGEKVLQDAAAVARQRRPDIEVTTVLMDGTPHIPTAEASSAR